jgi:uncharacterized protein
VTRIALDIDSTLHHYWDLLERIVLDRHGVSLPYAEQHEWGITEIPAEDVRAAVMETHSDENIAAAEPYPGAVETVTGWHEAGHFIHVTSHRAEHTRAATADWLREIDLPYDDLHCSWDKITRCVELDIDVLVDDSPVNIRRAKEVGITPATILHPWNEEAAAEVGAVTGRDWSELRDRMAAVLQPA